MKFINKSIYLTLITITSITVNASLPDDFGYLTGFGQYTTGGGDDGVEYHVNSLSELREALENNGRPNEPKIIYIDSPINGHVLSDGSMVTDQYLSPGYSFEKYLNCFTEDGSKWIETDECNKISNLRTIGINAQKDLIYINVTSNTTIIGKGNDSRIQELSFHLSGVDNVILKNLSIEAPNDFFPKWATNDSSWNGEFDAVVLSGSTNIWIDNCLLDDGDKILANAPVHFNKNVERHDGLIDIVDASDYVTISNCRFENHKKNILIGNSDRSKVDSNHLHVSIYNNVFLNCWQRIPRVRFGKVHVYNNYVNFVDDGKADYIVKLVGLGFESDILSEYNSYNYVENKKSENVIFMILDNYGGYTYHDNGSYFNNEAINLDEFAKENFELNVVNTKNKNLASGKSNPNWINANFTTETFNPLEFYNYTLSRDINKVNELQYKIPTWMFAKKVDELEEEIVSNNSFNGTTIEDEEITLSLINDNDSDSDEEN